MKNQLSILKLLPGLAVLALTSHLTGAAAPQPRFAHPREITNPFLPLGALQRDVLESRNPRLSGDERQDLSGDLNEDGLSDLPRPTQADLPFVVNWLILIAAVAPDAMDRVNADSVAEAHKDPSDLSVMFVRVAAR